MGNNIFDTGIDDYMFPVTRKGMNEAGMVLESTAGDGNKGDDGEGTDAVSDAAITAARSRAMSSVLTWLDEGDYSYNALDEVVVVAADIDGDWELSDGEEEEYGDIWDQIGDALLTLGAEFNDVQALVDGPGKKADEAAARIGAALSKEMESVEAEDADIIAGFALGEDAILENAAYDEALHGVLEATYKRKKVVRDGKVKIVRKRVSGKIRLSAAQKAGLRKARRKANTAAAKLHRRKSMKLRERRGL